MQDLNTEIETMKKSQRETTLERENLGKIPGVIDPSISNRIQKLEERTSGAEDTIENIYATVKKKKTTTTKKNPPISKHSRNPGHNEKSKPMDRSLQNS